MGRDTRRESRKSSKNERSPMEKGTRREGNYRRGLMKYIKSSIVEKV